MKTTQSQKNRKDVMADNKQRLSQIWDVLVKHAGASEGGREAFLARADEYGRERMLEYRFIGTLGFGGKVWLNNGPLSYVNCDRGGESEGRRKLMEIANGELKLLGAQYGHADNAFYGNEKPTNCPHCGNDIPTMRDAPFEERALGGRFWIAAAFAAVAMVTTAILLIEQYLSRR